MESAALADAGSLAAEHEAAQGVTVFESPEAAIDRSLLIEGRAEEAALTGNGMGLSAPDEDSGFEGEAEEERF